MKIVCFGGELCTFIFMAGSTKAKPYTKEMTWRERQNIFFKQKLCALIKLGNVITLEWVVVVVCVCRHIIYTGHHSGSRHQMCFFYLEHLQFVRQLHYNTVFSSSFKSCHVIIKAKRVREVIINVMTVCEAVCVSLSCLFIFMATSHILFFEHKTDVCRGKQCMLHKQFYFYEKDNTTAKICYVTFH